MSNFDYQNWQRWFPNEKKPPVPQSRWSASRIMAIIGAVILLFILVSIGKGWYTDWLWFSSLNYGTVFSRILVTKVVLFFIGAAVFCLLFSGNLLLATRLISARETGIWPWAIVQTLQRSIRINTIIGTGILSLIFGLVAAGNWQTVLEFLNGQPFNITDPVFTRDIAFYVFSLPFIRFIRSWLIAAFIITALGTFIIYAIGYLSQKKKFGFERPVSFHIGTLLFIIFGLLAWGYWLGIWELVFSPRGVVFGASYADMHAKLPAQWILFAGGLLVAISVVVTIIKRNFRWILYSIGGWIALIVIAGGIYPALIQRFQVEPSELVRETPYIEHNIKYTREAYALDRIEEQAFDAEDMPSAEDIANNELTIENVRLWDPRPLKDTYNQLQSIRLYYDFNDVDIDRYMLDGTYRQVMLSARELSAEKLSGQAQTWVNRKLQFTHGYGAVLSPVNEITTQGLPNLLIKDIPPVGNIEIDTPQIYYGEKTDSYVIIRTNTQEFDYPSGDENVYTRYEGEGGVPLDSFLRRAIYAWELGDFNILISSELNSESRVMYHRDIQERVHQLAPFLTLDADPYLVIIDGKLYWVQDAYTTTNQYPYSEPVTGNINYIRNSVKAVVDAYNGSVTLYVTDQEDALIRTYQSIFPELFAPYGSMPEEIKEHIRYPEYMLNIQATVYRSYHMQDARVFYNKEDLWAVPKEIYAGSEQAIEPYYVIMRLPDQPSEEFMLIMPFTPVNKNNTISWLAARSDGDNYGKLLVYRFPKDRLVYGPIQIENRIQQDTVITEQFALWGRGGSNVLRGNLLFLPIEQSILYVEPVFLQAETGGLPELKRVIVAAGDRIAMEPTLQEALTAVFGETAMPEIPVIPVEPTEPGEIVEPVPVSDILAQLIEKAQSHYTQAQEYLKAGDWTGYGQELEALEETLNRMSEELAKE